MPRRGANHLSAEELGGVVEVGIDEDHLDAELLHPEAPDGALEGRVDAAAGGLGVGRPEDDHLGVLERVFEQVVLLGDAEAVAVAPHGHGAPVPALPAVRVVLAVGEAHEVHEAVVGAVAVADVAPQVVRALGGHDRAGADLAVTALDLVGDDVEGFVPADGLVAGHAAVLDVARALGVEVDALERREDALGRVDHRALRLGVRRQGGLARRGERAAARLDRPVALVFVVELDGGETDDPAVLHVDEDRATRRAVGQSFDFSHAPLTSASRSFSVKRLQASSGCGRCASSHDADSRAHSTGILPSLPVTVQAARRWCATATGRWRLASRPLGRSLATPPAR